MDSKGDIDVMHLEDVILPFQRSEGEQPWHRQPELRKLYMMFPFLFLGSTTLGYDGSLLNGLQTMQAWQECTHISNPFSKSFIEICCRFSPPNWLTARPSRCIPWIWRSVKKFSFSL